jgi:hypothetical protein
MNASSLLQATTCISARPNPCCFRQTDFKWLRLTCFFNHVNTLFTIYTGYNGQINHAFKRQMKSTAGRGGAQRGFWGRPACGGNGILNRDGVGFAGSALKLRSI